MSHGGARGGRGERHCVAAEAARIGAARGEMPRGARPRVIAITRSEAVFVQINAATPSKRVSVTVKLHNTQGLKKV